MNRREYRISKGPDIRFSPLPFVLALGIVMLGTLSAAVALGQGAASPIQQLHELREANKKLKAENKALRRAIGKYKSTGEDKANPASTKKMSGGWRDLPWGSEPEDVKNHDSVDIYVGDKDAHPTMLGGDHELLGYGGSIRFLFFSDQLYHVSWWFNEHVKYKKRYLEIYWDIQQALTKKYGEPVKDESIWLNDRFSEDPDKYGWALYLGDLMLSSTWKVGDTIIQLECAGGNNKAGIKLRYMSEELMGRVQKANKERVRRMMKKTN